MNPRPAKQSVTFTGIAVTIAVTAGIIWAILQLLDPGILKREFTPADMRQHEITAFKNLQRIAAAQKNYRQKDYDRDGEAEFAMFYVHLYRSVSPDSKPIPVNLISKRLAFAMGISRMLDGYYFKDLRQQELESGDKQPFDYTRQWAVVAMPASKGRTGVLTMIAGGNGAVYVTPKMHTELYLPFAPEHNGWARITSLEELKRFQQHVVY